MIKHNINVFTLIQSEIYKLRKVGIETAHLDCRLLLTHSLKLDKTLHNYETITIYYTLSTDTRRIYECSECYYSRR